MRWIFLCSLFFLILSTQTACTLYESDGREAISENKADIVVVSGYDVVYNIGFECFKSLTEPKQTKSPVQVIEHEFEQDGYSAYLMTTSLEVKKEILVYQGPENSDLAHRFCHLDTQNKLHQSKIQEAIELGVILLEEQKQLD